MPIFFQQDIDETTKLGIWKIEEDEDFFLQHVPLQREITHPHKRLQHLAGRFLLQHLFPDFPVSLIKIADTRKPFLEGEAYHFSISHCDNYAAAIVSTTERVGVDVEVPTSRIERIKNKFLNEDELVLLDHENPESEIPNPKLTLMWCCKEAVYKWWSYGGVDFSEKIRLQPFKLQPCGNLPVKFLLGNEAELILNYKIFDKLCLAWLKT
ncbi:MAG: 4'-phosphopantetheinyl transferase superfamily protein [Flavisolibacter sp.]|nr:4'-phosphopantetheinyl transferase superfamily protein [Flavisolibacter sp.]